jgi:hypothetical protein
MYVTRTTSAKVDPACLSRFDILETLFCLISHVRGNGHRRVIETGRAGDEDPISIHDGA